MKNTKENILKVLKGKSKSYWKLYKIYKERGIKNQADNYFELFNEVYTIILYFENSQFFNETANLWIPKEELEEIDE